MPNNILVFIIILALGWLAIWFGVGFWVGRIGRASEIDDRHSEWESRARNAEHQVRMKQIEIDYLKRMLEIERMYGSAKRSGSEAKYTKRNTWRAVLGFEPDAEPSVIEIRRAFANKAMQYHPDRGGNVELFHMLMKARDEALREAA